MIQDLHSHTYYSYCGKDSPEAVIKNAIANGIELMGISDHYCCQGDGSRSLKKSENLKKNMEKRLDLWYNISENKNKP